MNKQATEIHSITIMIDISVLYFKKSSNAGKRHSIRSKAVKKTNRLTRKLILILRILLEPIMLTLVIIA